MGYAVAMDNQELLERLVVEALTRAGLPSPDRLGRVVAQTAARAAPRVRAAAERAGKAVAGGAAAAAALPGALPIALGVAAAGGLIATGVYVVRRRRARLASERASDAVAPQ
jgi:hypothetical protein